MTNPFNSLVLVSLCVCVFFFFLTHMLWHQGQSIGIGQKKSGDEQLFFINFASIQSQNLVSDNKPIDVQILFQPPVGCH